MTMTSTLTQTEVEKILPKTVVEAHLETLERYNLLETRRGFRGNFIKKPLACAVAVVGTSLLFGCSTIPDSSIPCLDIKVQVCPVKTDPQGR
jgi:hypothetical protein